MRRAKSGRRGGVFIALTSVTLGTLLIATLMRLDWSSRALSEAGDGAGGAVAENLALSAVAEALWRFQTEGNQPGEQLFLDVRAKLRETEGPIDLSKLIAPERLAKALATGEAGGSFGMPAIEHFEAILRPADAPATLAVRCTVRVDHGMGSFARRTARESRRWGLNGVFAPQPLDQPSAALLRADVLSRHVPTLGRWQDAIREHNRAVRDFRALVETVNTLPPVPGKETVTVMPTYFSAAESQLLSEAENRVVAEQRAAQPWRTRERILERERNGGRAENVVSRDYHDLIREDVYFAGRTPLVFKVERTLQLRPRIEAKEKLYAKTLLEAEHAANTLLSFAAQVELERWDPNARFEEAIERSLSAFGKVGARIGRLEAHTAASEPNRAGLQDGGVQEYVRETDRLLVQMAGVIAAGTSHLNDLTRAMLAETRAPLEAPEAAGRAHPSISAHTGVTELAKWFKRFKGANGGLAVRWKQDEIANWKKEHGERTPLPPLELDLEGWEGKSLIDLNATETTLKKLKVDDGARDRVVLRVGKLTLTGGRVDAGVYADSVSTKNGTDIHGALVIGCHAEEDGEEPRRLKGTLTHDARMQAGVFVDGEDDTRKPDWRRVCDASYVLILDPQGWERDVRQSRGKR